MLVPLRPDCKQVLDREHRKPEITGALFQRHPNRPRYARNSGEWGASRARTLTGGWFGNWVAVDCGKRDANRFSVEP